MRCFIAVELPQAVKIRLREFQEELKRSGADVRWIKPDNIHLTLKFLGETEEEKVLKIKEALEKNYRDISAFSFEIKGAGVFPGMRSPRVLWLGIEDSDVLKTLQAGIEDETAGIGFKREDREFRAHITVGRFRSSRGKKNILDAIKLHANDSFGKVDVRAVSLMKSDLYPDGARHTRVFAVSLKSQLITND